jgi:hypothetical protein
MNVLAQRNLDGRRKKPPCLAKIRDKRLRAKSKEGTQFSVFTSARRRILILSGPVRAPVREAVRR